MGTAGTVAALRRIPGLEVKELDSGCCGMAGSFGYERGHYEVSAALANRVSSPRGAADPAARLVAPGFSCRSQVHGLAGIEALHPIEVLAEQLRPAGRQSRSHRLHPLTPGTYSSRWCEAHGRRCGNSTESDGSARSMSGDRRLSVHPLAN